jgi:hypothetical protein
LAVARLVYFGSDLVADPIQIESDEDWERFLDRAIVEWLQPKALARKLVNGERLTDDERRIIERTEATLKDEAERFHRELVRRLTDTPVLRVYAIEVPSRRAWVTRGLKENAPAFVISVLAIVVATLILVYLFHTGG